MTTQMQYKIQYKTRTVPVTRTVVEQVPTTVMQTKYKVEYKTQTVPVKEPRGRRGCQRILDDRRCRPSALRRRRGPVRFCLRR